MSGANRAVDAGREALGRGEWHAAKVAFEEALERGDDPEALAGLGEACAWLGEGEAWRRAHERAYRIYRERGSPRDGARMAFWLALGSYNVDGDADAAQGWLERARHLLAELDDPGLEAANVAAFGAHLALLIDHDPARARVLCAEAIGLATGEAELAMLVTALEGLAMVTQGDVGEGMRRLDQASVAATSGELRDPLVIENVCCYQIYACKRVRDFPRAGRWCERTKLIAERWSDWSLFGTCRLHYSDVLVARGALGEAEGELDAVPANRRVDVAVRLAELRRRQGSLARADELLVEAEPHVLCSLVKARIALDRDDPESAHDLAERYLRRIGDGEQTERIGGLEVLARARLSLDDPAGVRAAAEELHAIADRIAADPVLAGAALAQGLVAIAEGDDQRARRHLEDAIDLYERAEAPYEAAMTRLDLAQVLRRLGRHEAARKEAQAGSAALGALGVALSRRTEAEASPEGLTRRELEVLALIGRGRSNQQIAGDLVLSVRTVERHISNVYSKLGLTGRSARAAAASYAAGLGLS